MGDGGRWADPAAAGGEGEKVDGAWLAEAVVKGDPPDPGRQVHEDLLVDLRGLGPYIYPTNE